MNNPANRNAPDFLINEDGQASLPVPSAAEVLTRVTNMCLLMSEAEARVLKAEEELKQRKRELFQIAQVDLPELLNECGLKSVTLANGAKVTVDDSFSCSITEANAPAALGWLRDNGHDAVIKTQVIVQFGKGEVEKADAVYIQLAEELGHDHVQEKESVHPQTLKALLRELREGSVDVPSDLFSIQPYSIAKIQMPKSKRAAAS